MNAQIRIETDSGAVTGLQSLELPVQYNSDGTELNVVSADVEIFEAETRIPSSGAPGTIVLGSGNDNFAARVDWFPAVRAELTEGAQANYRAAWKLNGALRIDQWFDVVWWRLVSTISDVDMIQEAPILDVERPEKELQISQVVNSLTYRSETLVEPDNFWVGSFAEFQLNQRQFRAIITDYLHDTKEFSIETAPSNTVQVGDFVLIRHSYKSEIDAAFKELIQNVNAWVPVGVTSRGLNIVVDSFDVRQLHLNMAVARAARNLRGREDDAFDQLLRDYESKAAESLQKLRAKIDEDNDGAFDSSDSRRGGTTWLF